MIMVDYVYIIQEVDRDGEHFTKMCSLDYDYIKQAYENYIDDGLPSLSHLWIAKHKLDEDILDSNVVDWVACSRDGTYHYIRWNGESLP